MPIRLRVPRLAPTEAPPAGPVVYRPSAVTASTDWVPTDGTAMVAALSAAGGSAATTTAAGASLTVTLTAV